jgi:hypothetical protein
VAAAGRGDPGRCPGIELHELLSSFRNLMISTKGYLEKRGFCSPQTFIKKCLSTNGNHKSLFNNEGEFTV